MQSDDVMGLLLFTSFTQDLTRLPPKAKAHTASGQGRHWLIESPTCFHLYVTRPSEICVNLFFKHIHAASIYQYVDNLYH